ncbi:MAG: amino acid permease [Planctomycetaceae bacterium]|nr:amino acid permease [Planctomycetaceae bacterium]
MATHEQLRREVGMWGAMLLGLGSIVGTGVFVSLSIAIEVAGSAVLLAIVVSAGVAACNGLSSAQLAANHPVSGGTYEYGYRWLTPALGFQAGWLFLCAKCASAATAALGCAGYLRNLGGWHEPVGNVPLACGLVLVMTLLVLSGLRRSNRANALIVSATLVSLSAFVLSGFPQAWQQTLQQDLYDSQSSVSSPFDFLQACALMFVAFTGYGRIATLGEEVHEPRKTIPQAILATLVVSALLYLSVGWICLAAVHDAGPATATESLSAPLVQYARQFGGVWVVWMVSAGAVTAMLGVLLNLILGLSRVVLAMGRHGDIPERFAKLDASCTTPTAAVLGVGILVGMLTLIGNVKTTWSFSAFTVLVYYALTNLAALRLSVAERLYPRWISWLGLLGCLSLAFWVEPVVWQTGLLLMAIGWIYHAFVQRRKLMPSNDTR